jgi:signal transduction histidine kinase
MSHIDRSMRSCMPSLYRTARRSAAILAALGLALLGGSLLMADRLGRRFVEPIRSLAASAQAMGTDRETRVEPQGPREVQDVAAALNRLGDRVATLIARERVNVADLSHRLRTPITALRLSIDSLPAGTERSRIQEDVDNLERMVDFVVAEARRSQREGITPAADVVSVVVERTDFWRALAEDQDRAFVTDLPESPILVQAGASDLGAVVDILLDNVFSYTDEGTEVRVSLTRGPEGDAALLVVEDAGPGWPHEVDVVDRGVSASGSSGLGLSIVRNTAEASNGAVTLDRSGLGGARVEVLLGPAT